MTIPYCGAAPLPGTLGERWNGDPILIAVLAAIFLAHFALAQRPRRAAITVGWAIAAFAFLSPICALSVALFSARVLQHMILVLIAAPLIAGGLAWRRPATLWASTACFSLALWFWHMPVPYDATYRSDITYWAMHVSLFGSAIWLWRDLIHHPPARTFQVLAAGTIASVAMALLGAVIALSGHPMYLWHLPYTQAWGFTPLADQQLGGVIMWVPGGALFLLAAMRSMRLMWTSLERPMTE